MTAPIAKCRKILAAALFAAASALPLLLVGLPFLMQFERGRGSEGLVAGFLLCVFYFAADFVSLNMGLQGHASPALSSFLPTLLFGSLGLVLTSSARS